MGTTREPTRPWADWKVSSWGAVPAVMALAVVLAALPGCGGCRDDAATTDATTTQTETTKTKEKPKPDFEISQLTPLPNAGSPSGGYYKPGHWSAATLRAKANNFDFLGDLQIDVTDGRGRPIPLVGTEFGLTTTRQFSLAKAEPKAIESVLFAPATQEKTSVSVLLRGRDGGGRRYENSQRLLRMPSYQYHFVVLARSPEKYGFLNTLTSIKPPVDSLMDSSIRPYYRIVRKTGERPVVLPSHPLMWTTIACILWDDADPEELDSTTRQNLLDWLHWGGNLIISGPDTLDTLGGSFLEPYLPATAETGVWELGKEAFKELNVWNESDKKQPAKATLPLEPITPVLGVRLKKHSDAAFMSQSGHLLAERRVGRGRIVVSAFRLCDRQLTSWKYGYDEVFNAYLLRRPGRKFGDHAGQLEPGQDLSNVNGAVDPLQVGWADGRSALDPARVSQLRYFVRDHGTEFNEYAADVVHRESQLTGAYGSSWEMQQQIDWYSSEPVDPTPADTTTPPGPGVAAWNDFGPVANAVREELSDAAQVEIPDRSFVVWAVAVYLLILVPINWAVFRTIGRVEWAWIAAPVIAVVCTVCVIRMAQLDIGFVRAQTELAVIELQGDYPRAHVTRYTALYTSLGTSYDFHCDDADALIHAFPETSSRRETKPRDARELAFRRQKGADVSGYYVASNSTGMVHSEQMVDLAGGISWSEPAVGSYRLVNETGLALHSAEIVRRKTGDSGGTPQTETAWLGTIEPGDTLSVEFGTSRKGGEAPHPTMAGRQLGELDLVRLLEAARDAKDLPPGEIRLIAAVDDELPGPAADPGASQSQRATLLVAHLKYGFDADPQADKNTLPAEP